MSLTRADIERIARLSRLSLADDEVPRLVTSLSSILEFVGQLERAATEGIEPMAHPLPGQSQRLRADVVTESDEHERFQHDAPAIDSGMYLVPKVIE
jgi:aspartyl-tRNA(Asn)/glutamyl-tRNA(Gln) amidotransferase subunit C